MQRPVSGCDAWGCSQTHWRPFEAALAWKPLPNAMRPQTSSVVVKAMGVVALMLPAKSQGRGDTVDVMKLLRRFRTGGGTGHWACLYSS